MILEDSITVAIYRVVLGSYDRVIEDNISGANYDLFLFTDTVQSGFTNYQRIMLPTAGEPAMKNRELKINVPEVLRGYDVVIYLDANIQICRNIDDLIEDFFNSDADFGFFKHPYSENMEDETRAIRATGKAEADLIFKELKELRINNGQRGRMPLTDNSIILRKNYSKWDQFATEWYYYVKNFTGRDQLSLSFLREKHKLSEYIFSWSPRTVSNKFFTVFPHKGNLKNGIIRYAKNLLIYVKKRWESHLKRAAWKG